MNGMDCGGDTKIDCVTFRGFHRVDGFGLLALLIVSFVDHVRFCYVE